MQDYVDFMRFMRYYARTRFDRETAANEAIATIFMDLGIRT
jgi:hypothetical protein